MPKPFEPQEKAAIRRALIEAGLGHFERQGVRGARVEDICRDVGIAKGSFYAFFPSKEDLFMTIVEEREARHMDDMFGFIARATGTEHARAGGFFDLIRRKLETDPVLNLVLRHGEIAHLVRKLGPARFEKSQQRDRDFARAAVARWREAGGSEIDPEDLLGLMTLTLSLATQRAHMSGSQYEAAAGLLRELFVDRVAGRAA